MLHHQHFPLRDTGSVPSASAHSSALVTLWDLQQGRRREQVVVVPMLAVVAEVVTLSPAHESMMPCSAAAPGLHGMAVLADAVSCCILLLSHTAVPGLSQSFQGDGMGFSKGTGFPRAARHPQEGMVEQDSCWRGGDAGSSLEQQAQTLHWAHCPTAPQLWPWPHTPVAARSRSSAGLGTLGYAGCLTSPICFPATSAIWLSPSLDTFFLMTFLAWVQRLQRVQKPGCCCCL